MRKRKSGMSSTATQHIRPMKGRASARMTAFGELEIRAAYSDRTQLLVDDLKESIPARFRRWDPHEKVWRILGVYADTALDLLTAHYPHAALPGDRVTVLQKRNAARQVPAPPLPVPEIAPIAGDDQPERDRLVASVRCPRCGERHDQPVRVVTPAAATVARRESITPELVHVCPNPRCKTLSGVARRAAA
jgi:hypothetical protein